MKGLRILPFVLIPVFILLGLYLYITENTAESSTEGPKQPIPFSHKIHAGENRIACQYCHSAVAISPRAGIPSLQKCMGCHSQVAGRDVEYEYDGRKINIQKEVQKVREYWDKKTPIPWVKVYYIPEHAHFKHQPHIVHGFECKTCHGEVEKMDVVYRVPKLEMGWCINCHEENAKDEEQLVQLKDCLTCHY